MGRLAAPVVSAVLGPTNTGKTHLAVERMLGHASGMIGFPLRLLAREIYDRVVAARGRGRVALITGEERIVPPAPAYFVCTVEAMPLERGVEFLAVDEVQLAADGERGHVFTDRLLRARGSAETMFLGSQSAEPLIRRLFPEITVITRPRFSHLRYAGPSKLRRLPRRSAVVAFSLADVYALAELVRHQRGGTAVVLGALSPRTRNAQVAMFEAGEVDYLVATDAIGMGLNLDLGHVAFAALHKFDGHAVRGLTPEESAQIAGRAGRHMSDGTFGTTAELEALPADVVQRVEQHRFEALRTFQYRNSELDYRSIAALQRSLEAPPRYRGLVRCREADDQRVLKALVHDPEIAARATGRGAVALLWDVCRIPDYRKTLAEAHARLLGRIFRYLIAPAGRLPTDWVADQMARLDCADGDIDTLAVRTAHVRTWTYISHRPGWLDDPEHWQARARAIEDRLSDALHERLLQRFVDRRLSSLARRLRERSELVAGVAPDGEVLVEGIGAGRLEGFRFRPNLGLASGEGRTLRAAARGALRHEVVRRAAVLAQAPDDAFSWGAEGRLRWNGDDVARL
ncbi:MAG: disulfide oxidoreductase, partial [Alphaproteobacteria bacterium]|nr:disulfide oxidoreductase [Alphaproteobacteria bacterium]